MHVFVLSLWCSILDFFMSMQMFASSGLHYTNWLSCRCSIWRSIWLSWSLACGPCSFAVRDLALVSSAGLLVCNMSCFWVGFKFAHQNRSRWTGRQTNWPGLSGRLLVVFWWCWCASVVPIKITSARSMCIRAASLKGTQVILVHIRWVNWGEPVISQASLVSH